MLACLLWKQKRLANIVLERPAEQMQCHGSLALAAEEDVSA
jgi:hypothetical protein